MFASVFFPARILPERDRTAPAAPSRKSTPVFIGDAVQPLGRDTLLLEIIRRDARADEDQS
ncbi:hypothetical protein [Roseobacter ponti]|uniref:Uncharacterized protein n=1 Tax=Roseobacter ponti TaxID=1891787 RepID=A0A858SVT2_9RHOB|nr:hypothetical protein [Roseobacter ponti]QJF52805.1 hypothetical protein G3256_17300 [Roseobacter ponti]